METQEEKVLTLPTFPIGDVIPLPFNELKLDLSQPPLFGRIVSLEEGEFLVFLVKKEYRSLAYNLKDFFDVGVMAKIKSFDEESNGKIVVFELLVRCKILEFVDNKIDFVKVSPLPSYASDPVKELAAVRLLVNELGSFSRFAHSAGIKLLNKIQGISPDNLTDYLVFNLKLNYSAKSKYLLTTDSTKRLTWLLEDIRREKILRSIEDEINQKVNKDIGASQKEFYLREKMRVIQEELGDRAKKETDVDMLKKAILACKMPKETEEKALQELIRYSTLSPTSGESNISRTYLDFMISLPWSISSDDTEDINKARIQLDKDHYGLENVKERILEYLAVCIYKKKTPPAILCLVGPPGVGKTSLAKSIALALNKHFVKQSLGGVKDESEIRGHRRTYIGALPGRILQGIKRAGTNNPVFLLDEVDKLASDYRGDPASALLEVLDSEQNKYFSDNYLEEPFDLSKVFFIATANFLENVPMPLRDRLEIVELSSYTEYEKFEIAKRHLINKQLEIHGLTSDGFIIEDTALWRIIREYTRESGVRELERLIGTLIRKAIKKILEENIKLVKINPEDLENWLGKPKYTYSKLDQEDKVGLVTGLAYTQYGGDTLPIEATYYKGSGKLLLTGKLGDVMKESAQAALSFVRTNATRLKIDPDVFVENDIHIHVPEGAVPKDGPSAGVALITAIASIFTKKKVDHTLGMTGEITLRGSVLPIGGLREKTIAAHRSGLKKILIPKDNLKDLDEVPKTVLSELKIIPVSLAGEVLDIALLD